MTTTGQAATTQRQCKGTTKAGAPCQSFAVTGSDFCIMHSPERAAAMAVARRAGGLARHGRRVGTTGDEGPVKVTLASMADVLALLERTVNDVLLMENSLSRARVIGSLCTSWGQLWESSELERRVAALEALDHDDTTGTAD